MLVFGKRGVRQVGEPPVELVDDYGDGSDKTEEQSAVVSAGNRPRERRNGERRRAGEWVEETK